MLLEVIWWLQNTYFSSFCPACKKTLYVNGIFLRCILNTDNIFCYRTSKRGAFALGQFSLNVTEFPTDNVGEQAEANKSSTKAFTSANPSTRKIATILKRLLPTLVELPLSLDILNGTNFYPRSDDENLLAGVLQLPDGTCVLVDETMLKEGTLKEQGKFV